MGGLFVSSFNHVITIAGSLPLIAETQIEANLQTLAAALHSAAALPLQIRNIFIGNPSPNCSSVARACLFLAFESLH